LSDLIGLRQRALVVMQASRGDLNVVASEDARRLLYELQLHHIELELQNDELHRAHQALLRSEVLYRELYESAPVGYLTLDAGGEILRANAAAAHLLKADPDELRGCPLGRWLSEEGADWLFKLSRNMAEPGESSSVEVETSAGGRLHLACARAQGEDRVLVALSDVSERWKLEQELLLTRRMEGLAQLAAGSAHDLASLLSGIISCCDLASRDMSEDDIREALATIHEAAKRGMAIIRQQLSFAREPQSQPELIHLDEVIRGATRLLDWLVGGEIKLVYHLDAAGPVRAPPGQLEQVLVNLVLNARDALDGGGVIEVTTATLHLDDHLRRVPPGDYASLEVYDGGCGMDRETSQRALDPFFTTKAVEQGSGLGLASVQAIAHHLSGHVLISSALNQGTTVRVLLPLSQA
jgi:two-component system cell cycle sensor histidine kinase/response regulator CckA